MSTKVGVREINAGKPLLSRRASGGISASSLLPELAGESFRYRLPQKLEPKAILIVGIGSKNVTEVFLNRLAYPFGLELLEL